MKTTTEDCKHYHFC